MSPNIYQMLFYMKYSLINVNQLKFYNWLKRNENLTIEELNQLNWLKRRKLIKYAYDNIRFYHKKYRSMNIRPEDILKPNDWAKIPIITKNDIRNNFEDFISVSSKNRILIPNISGGSTGIPLKTYRDRRVPLEAIGWRMMDWWELEPWSNSATVRRMMDWLPENSGKKKNNF